MSADETEARAAARVGTVLNDKWTLERLLGIGGMAAVYAGRHRNGARAAVKVLHPELARHEAIRDRFLREGYAANRVEHPGAVSVLDDDVIEGGKDAGTAYLVMELLVGESLEDRAGRGPFTEIELLEIADSVLEVLEAAHAHGVVHRDLKPDNLFLLATQDGHARVKVLDFGLARIVEAGGPMTRAGMALGTPAYMSPEQAAGRADEIDGRSDLFSLAAVLFRLRTGKRVHEAGNVIELVAKMAKVPAPPIRSVDDTVSEPFAAIVDRALKPSRDDRYPDASAMRRDVRALLEALQPVVEEPPPPPVSEPRRSGGGGFYFFLSFLLIGVVAALLLRGPVMRALQSTPASVESPMESSSEAAPPVASASESAAPLPSTSASAGVDAAKEEEEEEEEEEGDAAPDAELDAQPDAPPDAEADAPDASEDAFADAHATSATPAPKPVPSAKPAPKPSAKPKPSVPAPAPKKKKKKKKQK